MAEAVDSPVLDQASQAGGGVEVRAILCLAAVVMEGQAEVEDMEAQVEMVEAMEAQGEEGQQVDSLVEEEMDMELPVEDLAVKCRCSSVPLLRSKSARVCLDSSARQ